MKKQNNAYNNWKCSCGEIFRTRRDLYNHKKVCKKTKVGEQPKQLYTCDFCKKSWTTTKTGFKTHTNMCQSNPNRIDSHWLGRKHSTESKLKISEGAKKAHDEGRGHTWKNRYNNPSFAEKWLYSVLDELNVSYRKEFPFFGFFLDTAIIDKGICIEIDGEQHYDPIKFPEQIELDKRKDMLLKDNGWVELRLRWSDVQRNRELSKSIIKDFIDNNYSEQVVSKLNKLKNERLEQEKQRSLLKEQGKIDKQGIVRANMVSTEVWEERKFLILNSNIDLTKFGWIQEVVNKTGLSKREVYNTVKHFDLLVYKLNRAKY